MCLGKGRFVLFSRLCSLRIFVSYWLIVFCGICVFTVGVVIVEKRVGNGWCSVSNGAMWE